MFSIGEFARLGVVSIRTLRHYDEIGLLSPAEVDPVTGYRSYSAKQLRQLNRIVALEDLGPTLGQIRRLLDGITVDELRGMLLLRQAQLERELQRQRHHLLGVEARLRHIAQEDDMPADDIVVEQIPPFGVVVIADTALGVGLGGHRARGESCQGEVRSARHPRAGQGDRPVHAFCEQTDGQEVTGPAGATGGLGRLAVAEAARRGHDVATLVRDPARANLPEPVVTVRGDVLDPVSVGPALAGKDAAHRRPC